MYYIKNADGEYLAGFAGYLPVWHVEYSYAHLFDSLTRAKRAARHLAKGYSIVNLAAPKGHKGKGIV